MMNQLPGTVAVCFLQCLSLRKGAKIGEDPRTWPYLIHSAASMHTARRIRRVRLLRVRSHVCLAIALGKKSAVVHFRGLFAMCPATDRVANRKDRTVARIPFR
jgi:hypothetical protein